MPVVSAFLVPGSPLPKLKPEISSWGRLAAAVQRAGRALEASRPDAVLLYSTQWYAVLDEQWLTRRRSTGIHVDENWYEFGDLPYDLHADTELAHACVAACPRIGVHARGVNYDGFPIDSGTIAASSLLGIGSAERPLVVASNNLYHDAQTTEQLGALAAACADEQGKRVAVVGVGGLSGSLFRTEIDPRSDRLASSDDDKWNQRVLRLIESGDVAELRRVIPEFSSGARADMGFKHFHWILGALKGRFVGARVHAYGPVYGSGAAVVEFTL
ncbi:MAG: tRNA U-34 5-methylaminomethyl-2-thiouridine biosynthesis protein [Burkholderiales bacterium]|nr:tRNA U-34 5-methylaminomethyl-2-thiouridine biosynthesis protein [Burkholderiales bacterium]